MTRRNRKERQHLRRLMAASLVVVVSVVLGAGAASAFADDSNFKELAPKEIGSNTGEGGVWIIDFD